VYSPFENGETVTFVDSVTGREFTMGLSGTTFTLTVAPPLEVRTLHQVILPA